MALGMSSPSRADEPAAQTADQAISHALDFLAANQAPDGSFGAGQKPAVTGLTLMAFLSCGHTPNAGKFEPNIGKYGTNVRAAIDYLIAQAQADGSFGRPERAMYGQAIATLALAQAYGVDLSEIQRTRTASILAASVKFIVTAQEIRKPDLYARGWGNDPGAGDSNLSASAWNVMALRACQDVGIAVPRAAIERAERFVLKCYNPQTHGFSNQPGGTVLPALTAIGIVCLASVNATRPEMPAAIQTLLSRPVDDAAPFPYEGLYNATQAAFAAGDAAASQVSLITFDAFRQAQLSDGGWPNISESLGAGRTYATSMAVLTLALPYRLMPGHQR